MSGLSLVATTLRASSSNTSSPAIGGSPKYSTWVDSHGFGGLSTGRGTNRRVAGDRGRGSRAGAGGARGRREGSAGSAGRRGRAGAPRGRGRLMRHVRSERDARAT